MLQAGERSPVEPSGGQSARQGGYGRNRRYFQPRGTATFRSRRIPGNTRNFGICWLRFIHFSAFGGRSKPASPLGLASAIPGAKRNPQKISISVFAFL